MDLQRRHFLRGRLSAPTQTVQLPWLISNDSFYAECNQCLQCLDHCPESIIKTDADGYPIVDFSQGECVFCGECAKSCPLPLFDMHLQQPAWNYRATIQSQCLAQHGITCRSCQDSCEARAIQFELYIGLAAQPHINEMLCNACGACVSVCPASAISMFKPKSLDHQKESHHVS